MSASETDRRANLIASCSQNKKSTYEPTTCRLQETPNLEMRTGDLRNGIDLLFHRIVTACLALPLETNAFLDGFADGVLASALANLGKICAAELVGGIGDHVNRHILSDWRLAKASLKVILLEPAAVAAAWFQKY